MQMYALENLAHLPYETADEPLFVLHTVANLCSTAGDTLAAVGGKLR